MSKNLNVLKSDLAHKFTVTNEDNVSVEVKFDPTDMVSVNFIVALLAEYDKLKDFHNDLENIDSSDIDVSELLAKTQPLSDQFIKIGNMLDLAFGSELRTVGFKGSYSMVMYNDFFNMLGNEAEKSGIKTKEYVTQLRKEKLLTGHKQSDTL